MKATLLSSLALSLTFGTLQLTVSSSASAGVNVQSLCMNGLLHTVVASDGTPYGRRTMVDSKTAGDLCSVVTTESQAKNVRVCVMKTLYKFVAPDGGVFGQPTDTTGASVSDAADLCSNIKSLNNSPKSSQSNSQNIQDGQNSTSTGYGTGY